MKWGSLCGTTVGGSSHENEALILSDHWNIRIPVREMSQIGNRPIRGSSITPRPRKGHFWVLETQNYVQNAPMTHTRTKSEINDSVSPCTIVRVFYWFWWDGKIFALKKIRALRARFFKLKYLFLNQIYHETHDLARRRRKFLLFYVSNADFPSFLHCISDFCLWNSGKFSMMWKKFPSEMAK